ncbi:hypothetical protein BKK47_09570 [Rodentibacter mrazii]|uniref:Sel1 repeat family protein n=1 Tax=Rodentibacter mrazii TaxID=1908257 RepID=A0A1V3ID12_9PAST|nr:tetratricopeptide repeat protein [Rodentibacter mrazii]OOF38331.1 hypothetical protein BKK47_09570 [Rodentibacter mrazii]
MKLFFSSILYFLFSSAVYANNLNCENFLQEKNITYDTFEGQEIYRQGIEYYNQAYGDDDNTKIAFCLFTDAKEKSVPDAEAMLSEFYQLGYIVDKDLNEAILLAKKAYKKGSILSLNQLGIYYGEKKDFIKSAQYYQKAIDEGDLDVAKANLGFLYFTGRGVEKNIDKAVELTKSALSTDNNRVKSMALANLGGFYYALGLNKEAFQWTEQGALLGNVTAETNLGFFFGHGIGATPNKEQALYWLNKAVAQNHLEALFILGTMYSKGTVAIKKDLSLAYHYYMEAAEKGHSMAKNNLASMLIKGRGVSKDDKKALALYLDAANDGNVLSMYALHQIYSQGTEHISKDTKKAQYWLNKAKQNGLVLE